MINCFFKVIFNIKWKNMTIAFLNLAESSLWLEGGRVSGGDN